MSRNVVDPTCGDGLLLGLEGKCGMSLENKRGQMWLTHLEMRRTSFALIYESG